MEQGRRGNGGRGQGRCRPRVGQEVGVGGRCGKVGAESASADRGKAGRQAMMRRTSTRHVCPRLSTSAQSTCPPHLREPCAMHTWIRQANLYVVAARRTRPNIASSGARARDAVEHRRNVFETQLCQWASHVPACGAVAIFRAWFKRRAAALALALGGQRGSARGEQAPRHVRSMRAPAPRDALCLAQGRRLWIFPPVFLLAVGCHTSTSSKFSPQGVDGAPKNGSAIGDR